MVAVEVTVRGYVSDIVFGSPSPFPNPIASGRRVFHGFKCLVEIKPVVGVGPIGERCCNVVVSFSGLKRRLPRYTREHYFNLARMIFNLRPRFTKSFVSRNTGRIYATPNRLSSELLGKFGNYIAVELATALHAMEHAMDFHKKREERFKKELASTITAHPFVTTAAPQEAAHA